MCIRDSVNPSNNLWVGIAKKIPAGTSAKMIIDKYISAIGGLDKVKSITDLSQTMAGSIQGTEVVMNLKQKIAGKYMQTVNIPAAKETAFKIIVNGDSIWAYQYGQQIELPEDSKASYRAKTAIFPELSLNVSKLILAPELVAIGESLAYQVTQEGVDSIKIERFYDEKSGLKLKENVIRPGVTNFVEFSDYRNIAQGVLLPYNKRSDLGGYQIEYKMKELKANSGLTDDSFK